MNKIFCQLILSVLIFAGCIIATPFNDESAEKGLNNLKNSLDDGRVNEVWYRMSYEIRDKYDYKFFAENWAEISNKLSVLLQGEVTSQKEIETPDHLQGILLKSVSESQIVELLFVAELDKARFPNESEVVWRFRGVYQNFEKNFDFGFLPIISD